MAIRIKKKPKVAKKIAKKTKLVKRKVVKSGGNKVIIKLPDTKFIETVGRRKTAVAVVRLYQEGSGKIYVNDKDIKDYFAGIVGATQQYMKPLELTDSIGKYTFSIKVSGSGIKGQLGAVIHGISRALCELDPENRRFLKPEGYLTRDPRMKESRKPGCGGKARRKRQSPKR